MSYYTRPDLQNLEQADRLRVSLIMLAILFAILLVAGYLQKDDMDKDDKLYCENVASGVYPDYNGNYHRMCPQAKEEDK